MSHITAVLFAGEVLNLLNSSRHAVLHEVCGKPMLNWALDAVFESGVEECLLLTEEREDVRTCVEYYIRENDTRSLKMLTRAEDAADALSGLRGHILFVSGYMPLIKGITLGELIKEHLPSSGNLTVLDTDEAFEGCVKKEQPEQTLCNPFCCSADLLQEHLNRVDCYDNFEHLLYSVSARVGRTVSFSAGEPAELMFIDDRLKLSLANSIMRQKILSFHMLKGVTVVDTASAYIDAGVEIGRDTVIYPGTMLEKGTVIGEGCIIGPNSRVRGAEIGNGAEIINSVVLESRIGNGTHIGPFAYVRPGSDIGSNVKIGDFVEVKKSIIGDGTKVSHLTYVGDAKVGNNVNLGCGVVFVNYNGSEKNSTTVEDNAFIGCNVNLVAPVTVKENAYVAAGSTITEEVPGNSLAIARSRQTVKEGWVIRKGMREKRIKGK